MKWLLKISLLSLLPFNLAYGQGSKKLKYEDLRLEVQNLSYFDSTGLFSKGAEAIIVARSEGHPEKESEINIYYGNHFYYKSSNAKAEKYFKKALSLAKKYKSNRFINLSKIRLNYIFWDKGNEKEAEVVFKSILKDAQNNKEYLNQIECYNALALIEERRNKFKNSLAYYLKGLKIAEDQNEKYYIAVFLNNIGLIKLNSNQSENALKDFMRAVKISEKLNNARLTSHLYNNIALIYMQDGKKEEAIEQYEKILVYARKSGNPREMAFAATNLSNIYQRDSNFKMAHNYCDTAIMTFKNFNLTLELPKGYLTLSQILIKEKKFNEAMKYVLLAEHLTDSTQTLDNSVGVHFIKSDIYANQLKYNLALEEYKEYKKLSDSLKELSNTRAISEMQSKYNFEKKESEVQKEKNQRLLAENKNLVLERQATERKKFQNIIIISSVILIFLLSGYFYVSYNRKSRKQQQYFSQQLIVSIEEERNRIAKDLHDDIGQSLSAIKSSVHFLAAKSNDIEKLNALELNIGSVIDQTRDISRKLYPSYLEKIGLVRSVARLMDDIQQNSNLVCSFEIDETVNNLSIDKLTHIYRIVQECVNNTIKHAEASALKVTIEKKDDDFMLIYQDNGKGITKNDIKNSGIGFMSLKERARILNGELIITDNSGKGFKLILNFTPLIENGKV